MVSFVFLQVVLAKYYIDILSIGKDSVDGRKLLNYRAPKNAKQVNLMKITESMKDFLQSKKGLVLTNSYWRILQLIMCLWMFKEDWPETHKEAYRIKHFTLFNSTFLHRIQWLILQAWPTLFWKTDVQRREGKLNIDDTTYLPCCS